MAFPSITGTNGGGTVVNATTSTINLPASIAAGDLLIAAVTVDANTGSAFTGWPAGWVELYATDSGLSARQEVRYKVAAGTEGASFVLTHVLNMSSHVTLKIAGVNSGLVPEAATPVTGTGTTPNPPDLNPALWDVADTLWLVILGWDDGSTAQASINASYTQAGSPQRGANGQSTGTSIVWQHLAAANLDPPAGTITLAVSEATIINTVAIAPAGTVIFYPFTEMRGGVVRVELGLDDISNLTTRVRMTNTSSAYVLVALYDGVRAGPASAAPGAVDEITVINQLAHPDDPAFTASVYPDVA